MECYNIFQKLTDENLEEIKIVDGENVLAVCKNKHAKQYVYNGEVGVFTLDDISISDLRIKALEETIDDVVESILGA